MTEISSKEIAALKARAHDLPATLHVGKSGVTDALAEELQAQLERQDLVKVRLLRSARGAETARDVAVDLATRAESTLVEVRGNTAVYYKPGRRGRRAR